MPELTASQEHLSIVEEPQLAVKFYKKKTSKKYEDQSTLKVLSLFSGCGGMDLGFEGDFSVLGSSVNELLHPDFIEKRLENGFVQLKKTRFKTIFSNDILNDARNAWVNYFAKRGHNSEDFYTDSIVDLVKLHRSGTDVFPQDIDIVTGGFPCQDFSIAGKRNGFTSHKNHKGELNTENTATEWTTVHVDETGYRDYQTQNIYC